MLTSINASLEEVSWMFNNTDVVSKGIYTYLAKQQSQRQSTQQIKSASDSVHERHKLIRHSSLVVLILLAVLQIVSKEQSQVFRQAAHPLLKVMLQHRNTS